MSGQQKPPYCTVTVVECGGWKLAPVQGYLAEWWGWKLVKSDGWEYWGAYRDLDRACREAAWLMGFDPVWPDPPERLADAIVVDEPVKGA